MIDKNKVITDMFEENAWSRGRIKELEVENARLRQQRDAANAQLDFLWEHLKKEE